ncbi:MAG: hypothetical protein QCH96_07560 [Candidatus Thermoplasmatota archaeon]|nr:hypothetical protein [Candidatus Thermoplasmatota archaeon]
MDDRLYPKAQLEEDLEAIKKMDIPYAMKIEKGNALMYLYYNQNDKTIIDPFSIADFRENILR